MDKNTKLYQGEAFGRIAYSTPKAELKGIEDELRKANAKYIQYGVTAMDDKGELLVLIARDPVSFFLF